MKFLALFAFLFTTNAHSQIFLIISEEQENCVFAYVKSGRPKYSDSDTPKPVVVYSHQIDLAAFQKEFQAMQGFTPDVFLNYFNNLLEKIFLYTSWDRYSGERSPLDSLAHEFTHYFQFVESGRDPDLQKNDYNDLLEDEAVRVQTAFRDLKVCR